MVCYRIRFKDLALVECDGVRYKKSSFKFPEAVRVAELFRKHGNLDLIRDGNFLIGEFCDGRVKGKRIDILPDGRKLGKGYSLFASGLVVHDERSNVHWDVLFMNPSGSFCYVYTLDKTRLSRAKKFGLVDDFEKCLPRLKRNLINALMGGKFAAGNLRNGDLVLAMLVLLKTKMRVGGEIYYKRNHHKGLTTLKKKDLKIARDVVRFDFIGKDGVPQRLEEKFDKRVIFELRKILKNKDDDDFVFLDSKGKVFRDTDFEIGFEKFCGKKFYPHIVRSHFATREVEKFLAKKKKENAREFCLGLAGKLGHKKFSKKSGAWEDNFEVTLHHYVRPDLVEKVRELF